MEDIKSKIFEILNDAKNEIVNNIDNAGETASGRTKQSLIVVNRGNSISLIKQAGDNAPMQTLEIGRPPGKVPAGFNEIILQWIRVKGIQVRKMPYKTDRPHKYSEQERSERMAAGAIAHKIETQGTNRHLQPRNDIYSNVVEKTTTKLAALFKDAVIKSIKTN